MKRTFCLITTIVLTWILPGRAGIIPTPYFVIEQGKEINPYEPFWNAIKQYESGNNPWIVNWNEMAVGIGQIRQCKLDDYNEAHGTNYSLWNCFSEEFSRKVFMWHCMLFQDIETAVKRWNGSGPATEIYWNAITFIVS